MIALLCSVRAEAERLLEDTVVSRVVRLGSKEVIEGTLANRSILLCIGGMGKVNASHAATLLVTQFHPDALLVFGIGGAYPSSGARVGDLAIANEEIAGDEGVLTQEGFKDTEYIGIPLLKTAKSEIYTTYRAPDPLQKLCRRRLGPSGNVLYGPFVTLSTCTGTLARAHELEGRYHGLCENMEGAAAAHVAELHEVPWLEVRGISNVVEDRDLRKWDIPKAAEAAQKAVIQLIEGWEA